MIRNGSLRPTVCLLALLMATAATAQKPVPGVVVRALNTPDDHSMIWPNSERVILSSEVPETLGTWDRTSDSWFGSQVVLGRTVLIVVGKSNKDAALPDRIGVDTNGDGRIDPDELLPLKVTSEVQDSTTVLSSDPVEVKLAFAGKEMAALVSFRRAGSSAPSASLVFPSFLQAKVRTAGSDRTVAVVDKDLDGVYGSAGDLWCLAASGDRRISVEDMYAMNERRFDHGNLFGINVSNDSLLVSVTPARQPDPQEAVSHRERVEQTWTGRFDKERASFIKAHQVNPDRPRTDAPIQWNYVTFDEGLALARRSGKPLFVDVMAFWCVWCYRMDYYTYPDKEVADLLNHAFIPVKIIQEQDLAGDYSRIMGKKLKTKGIPAMGIFNGDGKLLTRISGWEKPEDLLQDLKKGLPKS